MSNSVNNIYMEAQSALRAALAHYINAAEVIGSTHQNIADDVADMLCDASERNIVLEDASIK